MTVSNEKKSIKKTDDDSDLSLILSDIGGSFGKFQIMNYVIIAIPICLSGIFSLTYVFTAMNLDYRCFIPECDNIENYSYMTDWLQNVIPFDHGKPSKCLRYAEIPTVETNSSQRISQNDKYIQDGFPTCKETKFNRSKIIKCDDEGLIYRTNELTVVNEFDITCEENSWKLAMIGSYNNIARLMFMPLVGILSDKLGRKMILVIGLILSATTGILESVAVNYTMFVLCEFLCAGVVCIIYPAAFILGMEWAETKHRVTVTCLVVLSYPFGQALTGIIAYYARNFRIYLRIAFIPAFVAAGLMYFASDSLRWLLVKGKQKKVESLLATAAKVNGRQLSTRTMDLVQEKCELINVASEKGINQEKNEGSLKTLLSRKPMIIRFLICSFCWITGTFVNYGVSITSVSLHEDKYISYMIVSIGGIPAGLFTYFLLKYMGRPKCISFSFLMTGAMIIIAKLLPKEYSTLALILFLAGKCFSLHSFTSVYIYTTELWPTPLRHTMMGLCSMLGRIGSIMAPLAPLLGNIMEMLPYLSFGMMALIASILVNFLPETLNEELPDTLEEAENIGKKK